MNTKYIRLWKFIPGKLDLGEWRVYLSTRV